LAFVFDAAAGPPPAAAAATAAFAAAGPASCTAAAVTPRRRGRVRGGRGRGADGGGGGEAARAVEHEHEGVELQPQPRPPPRARDQWRHEVGVNKLNNKVAEARQNRALDQPVGALHGGGSVMSLKVATAAAAAGALRARRFHFLEIYKALTSKPLKRLRRTNKRRRALAIDR
jgi:hypothetical protein